MKKLYMLILVLLVSGTLIYSQSKLSAAISGAYLAPTGDFGDVYKDGFGGFASLNYNVTNNIQISLSSGYSSFSFNNDKYNEMLSDFFSSFGTTTKVEIDSKLKIIPITIGGKYFFTNTSFRPYATVEAGLHIISADGASVKVDGETLDAVKSESKTATAWGVGIGGLYCVSPKISIDVNAKICGNSLETGTSFSSSSSSYSSSTTSSSTVAFFSVSAGLVIEL